MNKLAEVNHEWETLWNLAHETKEYKAGITDNIILIQHYRDLAEDHARDYDTQEQEKKHAQSRNDLEKVRENEREQERLLELLKPLNETRERLTQKLSYMENNEKILTELTALKNNLETFKCSCNTSSLEAKVDTIIEMLGNAPKKPTTETKETQTEPINQQPANETPAKSTEELEKEEKAKELQELKNEIGKLPLTDLEKVLLKESEDKEHIEAIRNQAQTRIDKELAENKEKLEKEAKEKEEAEQKEQERLIQEQAEKERLERIAQELTNLKKEVELLNPNLEEKPLLADATNKEAIEKIKQQIIDRIAKEQAEREKWVKEFSNFKTEIERLGLNANEQKQLDDAIDKWQAEKVKSDAESRIKQEQAENKKQEEEARLAREAEELNKFKAEISQLALNTSEKELLSEALTKEQVQLLQERIRTRINKELEELAKQKAEREKKEQKLENERKIRQVANIVFDAEKAKKTRTNVKFYNYSANSDFTNDLANNVLTEKDVSFVLYRRKKGDWRVIWNNLQNFSWLSPDSLEEHELSREIEEVEKLTRQTSTRYPILYFGTRYKTSDIYSLMWSLAVFKGLNEADDYKTWIKNERNWLPQMEAEFAKYGA